MDVIARWDDKSLPVEARLEALWAEYDNLRGHRDRLWTERDAALNQLKGAVEAMDDYAAYGYSQRNTQGFADFVKDRRAARRGGQ